MDNRLAELEEKYLKDAEDKKIGYKIKIEKQPGRQGQYTIVATNGEWNGFRDSGDLRSGRVRTEIAERLAERIEGADSQKLYRFFEGFLALEESGAFKADLRCDYFSDLQSEPPLEFLIDGILAAKRYVILFAPPGYAKTYLALDWGLSIATDSDWFGRMVRGGPVVYVAAEGSDDIPHRTAAWLQHNGKTWTDLSLCLRVKQSVNLTDRASVEGLVEKIEGMTVPPVLVVFDTLSRCLGDSDEDSSATAGQVAHNVIDFLIPRTGVSVLALHHPGKNLKRGERGSSAWRGSCDYSIPIQEEKGTFRLSSPKSRSSRKITGVSYRLHEVEVNGQTNCVVVPVLLDASEAEKAVLAALPANGACFSEWLSLSGVPRSTFKWCRQRLQDRGTIRAEGEKYLKK